MSFICAICGVDFDIEEGRCPKCGSDRMMVTIRGDIDPERGGEWVTRVLSDPQIRERLGLTVIEGGESSENDRSFREVRIVDRGHGIELVVLQTKGAGGGWRILGLKERWLTQG